MKINLQKIMLIAGFAAAVFGFSFDVKAQTRPMDKVTVNKTVRFQRGKSSAVIGGKIVRGATHQYRLRAKAGQEMAVVLKTGNKTSLTIYNLNTGILEGADGVRRTVVELPETGEYIIEIGTDAGAANYTLEITIH